MAFLSFSGITRLCRNRYSIMEFFMYFEESIELATRIQRALMQDPSFPAQDIRVRAWDGKVTLDGLVKNKALAKKIVLAAKEVAGVNSVKNALKIQADNASDSDEGRLPVINVKIRRAGSREKRFSPGSFDRRSGSPLAGKAAGAVVPRTTALQELR